MKKIKGSISIYLCIVFLSIIVLISVLAERARVSTIQSKCKAVTFMATESVLAGYGKQVFEDYGLLLAWENSSVEESLKEYMQANINKADLKGTGTNFMDSNMVDIAECKKNYITDENGSLFLEQVKTYIKYAGLLKTAEDLVNTFTNYTESNNTVNKDNEEDITFIAEKDSDELQSIVKKINKEMEVLKNVKKLTEKSATFKQLKEDKNVNKIPKAYRNIVVILEEKEDSINRIINLINNYKKEKKVFLEKNNYTDSVSDYMENNLEILEKLRDNISKVRELNVSNISKWNSQSLEEINLCLEILEDILKSIDSLRVNNVTEKDKGNASIFESAKQLINKGVIALVIEDTKNISKNAISTINLPSKLMRENNNENLLDKATLLVYGDLKFGNYLKNRKYTSLKYEKEYLIGGKSSDSDNLAETIKQIIAIRNVVNVGVLLTSNKKMREITTIATSVAAVTGLPFMEIVAKAVLIEAWALAESIYEVKSLIKENKLPVIKEKEDWNTALENLLKEPKKSDTKKGMDYETYCNVLLMLQPTNKITYRMMDLIQENMQLRYNSEFLMEKCIIGLEVKTTFEIRPIFMSMPWTLNMNSGKDTYRFQISWESSY